MLKSSRPYQKVINSDVWPFSQIIGSGFGQEILSILCFTEYNTIMNKKLKPMDSL